MQRQQHVSIEKTEHGIDNANFHLKRQLTDQSVGVTESWWGEIFFESNFFASTKFWLWQLERSFVSLWWRQLRIWRTPFKTFVKTSKISEAQMWIKDFFFLDLNIDFVSVRFLNSSEKENVTRSKVLGFKRPQRLASISGFKHLHCLR